MRRLVLALLLIAAVSAPQAAPNRKSKGPKVPKLKIAAVQTPTAAVPGQPASLELTITTPEGHALNRYPGITLTLDEVKGLSFGSEKVFVGDTEAPEDLSKNSFDKKVEPLVVKFTPAKSGGKKRFVTGELKFFVCNKKDNWCLPGTQKVKFPVAVQ